MLDHQKSKLAFAAHVSSATERSRLNRELEGLTLEVEGEEETEEVLGEREDEKVRTDPTRPLKPPPVFGCAETLKVARSTPETEEIWHKNAMQSQVDWQIDETPISSKDSVGVQECGVSDAFPYV